jgi:hypothetical protein
MALPFTLRAGFAVQSGKPDCALPKESIQRKGNPGIVRKPRILANFEANARTRGSLTSNRSNMRIFKTSKQAKIPAH